MSAEFKSYEFIFALRGIGLPAPQNHVLVHMAMRAGKGGECWASAETLADDSGLGIRTVERATAELRRSGILVVGNASRRSRTYILNPAALTEWKRIHPAIHPAALTHHPATLTHHPAAAADDPTSVLDPGSTLRVEGVRPSDVSEADIVDLLQLETEQQGEEERWERGGGNRPSRKVVDKAIADGWTVAELDELMHLAIDRDVWQKNRTWRWLLSGVDYAVTLQDAARVAVANHRSSSASSYWESDEYRNRPRRRYTSPETPERKAAK